MLGSCAEPVEPGGGAGEAVPGEASLSRSVVTGRIIWMSAATKPATSSSSHQILIGPGGSFSDIESGDHPAARPGHADKPADTLIILEEELFIQAALVKHY